MTTLYPGSGQEYGDSRGWGESEGSLTMAIGDRYVGRGASSPKEPFHSPILEQLEPRLLLSGSEWLPGLVGSNDFLEHTKPHRQP